MEAVKFTLSGQHAFFKKPDVNEYCYFTYGHIHKVALLGMLGAIVGYAGYGANYNTLKKIKDLDEDYPEFYEKLRQLKIAVVPQNDNGYISKKIQVFNNSVGYANKDGNLIVREQWLEKPVWDIYILLDCKEAECISDYLKNNRCVYFPYLGKNDHPADIKNVQILAVNDVNYNDVRISSLFFRNIGEIKDLEELEDSEEFYDIEIVRYSEKLPLALNPYTNLYIYEDFCYINVPVRITNGKVYECESRIIQFF